MRKNGWIKLSLALCCLLAIILTFTVALAEEALVAERERTKMMTHSNGLRFVHGKEPAYDNGVWRMTIDTAATNWQAVIAAGYSASGDVSGLSVHMMPDASQNPVLISQASTGGATQQQWEEDLKFFQSREPNMGGNLVKYGVNLSINLGYFDIAARQFLPAKIEAEDRRTLFSRVKYADGTYDTRYVKVEVDFTSTSPVSVAFPMVPAENIIPNFGGTSFETTVSNGRVEYSNPTEHPQEITLLTAVRAPGTKQETTDWTAYYNGRKMQMKQDTNGHTVACTDMDLPGNAYADSDTSMIIWRDAEGTDKAYQILTQKVLHGNPVPWPEYVDMLVPFSKSDIKLKLVGGVDGTSIRQNGEKIHLAMDPAKLVAAAANGTDLTQAALQIQLKAPSNARYYSGDDVVTGSASSYGPTMADRFYPNGQYIGSLGELKELTDKWISPLDLHWFYTEDYPAPAGGHMKYCLSEWGNLATEYGAAVMTINWFDADKNPIGHNYLFLTFDRMELITLQPVMKDEFDLSKYPNIPRVVIKGGLPEVKGKVSLRAERLPSDPQTHYYHLNLVDENGNIVYADGKECDVYLPYPENYDRDSAGELEIIIGHYDQNMMLKEAVFSQAMGNLEFTPYGMRLRVKDFSPFVVSWKKADPVVPPAANVIPDVPKSGDSFPLYSLLLCGLVSLIGVCWLLRKKMSV